MARSLRLPAALLVATLGLVAASAARTGWPAPPGVPILLVAAAAAYWLRRPVGTWIALCAAVLVGFASLDPDVGGELTGEDGWPLAAARWVELSALATAATLAVRALAAARLPGLPALGRRTRRDHRPARDLRGMGQLAGFLGLSAVGAELLAAYGDSTGDPGGIAFALVFFAALYGAPALLARELVRRRGWGWPSLLLLFAALGVVEACLIDQSLFSDDYQDYEGWEESQRATAVPWLGISAFNTWNFVGGHVIYSFGAPLAVAEAWRPDRARQPWLGPVGLVIAGAAYLGAAGLILSDPESQSASASQLVASGLIACALVVAAVAVGRRGTTRHDERGRRRALPVWWAGAASFAAALVIEVAGESWVGVAISTTAATALAIALVHASRRVDWTVRHTAAVGLAFLLTRGLLAFTYFPLVGDVAPVPKYAHNAGMLLIVVLAGWWALRQEPHRGEETSRLGDPEL